MGLNKYDALHIFTILWLSTVSISLISLSIRHEQTDHRLQESLDALENQNINNPFIPNVDIGLDIDRNNERDSVKVEEEKNRVNSEPMNDMEDEKISVDVKKLDLVQEVEDIIISSSQSRHKEKPANFESALNAFSDEIEMYETSKRKKRGDTAFHRQLSSFDVDSREHREKSRASFQRGRHREISSRSLSERSESHTSTDLTLLKLKNLKPKERFIKEKASQENKKSIEAIENGHIRNRRVESPMNNDITPYRTSCILTKAEIVCGDNKPLCGFWASIGYCTNTAFLPNTDITWRNQLLQDCRKSCNVTCPLLPPLENQVQHEEIENIISTFDISMNVVTDDYARDTSWVLFDESVIFNSIELDATSHLVNNERHVIQYNCIISQNGKHDEEELQLSDKTTSTCYNFEVHDSFGDGICCMNGDGSFSMSVNTTNGSLQIDDEFEDGSVMNTSFCINHSDGQIESEEKFIKTKKYKNSLFQQCKNDSCLCDSKPSLSEKIQENHTQAFLLEVTMLSDSDKLQDVESAQYKAACWVLYDDPYEYDLVEEGAHNKRIQRYILAVFYFATSPEKWKEHSYFLSSRSECDWNYIDDDDQRGISCNEDGNVIDIYFLNNKNLEGTIAEELSGLRMLEVLNLKWNHNIRGTLPSVLGRLSQLRSLGLRGSKLEGTIPPQLFDATKLEELDLSFNGLEGTIPETIGNLQKLSELDLRGNSLSGSIPDAIHSLKNLKKLWLNYNKLSSSISSLIGKLNKLETLSLYNNMLTGQIPSTIGSLSSLWWLELYNNRLSGSIASAVGNMKSLRRLVLSNNRLSGPIPESLYDLPYLGILQLQDNSITGSVPDEFCERVDKIKIFSILADCRNDVFDPEVSCSCCDYCTDETPTWDDKCADATIKVEIDHYVEDSYASQGLEWYLTNNANGKKILYDGPYIMEGTGREYKLYKATYKACVAYSDCFSLNQISPPRYDTNYAIYWNDESIYNGTFRGYWYNVGIYKDDPHKTLLSFSYDEENQQVPSCYDVKLECYEEKQPIVLEPNTTERIMHDQATKISGRSIIQDTSSPQSKALCWMLHNNPYDNKTDTSDTEYIQRYILAILHFMSPDDLFGDDEYPPNTHECDWNGINCTNNNSKIVTDISISNKVMNKTLINEIGNLQYLEVLELSNTQLYGTIPRSFSNLWSLRKLDLSNNRISSTIPATLFRQLNELEYIDLSENLLIGTINEDIGSYSHIRTLLLRNNSLTGPFPLDTFKHTDLENIDISENELSGINFSLLLNHKKLKTLDLSNNFFSVSLLENTFTTLTELEYIDVSQNDISGTIPSTFPELSNITHLDMHDNRLNGPIPLDVVKLINIQHLNLQGNQLTGSLPDEINQLESLETLVLSHNELKGSIPFDNAALQNLKKLHLHRNQLVGESPSFNNMNSYITDCGFPSDLTDPVTCPTCDKCCNSYDRCRVTKVDQHTITKTLTFSFILIGFLILCYSGKEKIITYKCFGRFFSNTVSNWNALEIINDRSVYHFLLIKNKVGWRVGFLTGIFQIATLFLFVVEASSYSLKCPPYSLECEDTEPGINASPWGLAIFGFILAIWLTRDLVSSIKLMLLAMQKKSIDIMFAAGLVFFITMLAAWTSVYYNLATVTTDNELIVNTVVLLFVLEADERLYQLAACCSPNLVKEVEDVMEENRDETEDNDEKKLVIRSWLNKFLWGRKNEKDRKEDSKKEDQLGGDINADSSNDDEENMGQKSDEQCLNEENTLDTQSIATGTF